VIHDEHPFADPVDLRDPVRRFRGRLASPVTIVTAGGPETRTGLTVSSILVSEDGPARIYFLCGTSTDLWEALLATRAFVVHVVDRSGRELADRFAGLRPSPGGLFAGLDPDDSEHGPVIPTLETRARCSVARYHDTGVHALVEGTVDRVDLHDLTDPLQYFRGAYLGG
jgi:3-hydroxy-9,10-secoandrosta-1,3,5(10)-triene-9,17-dione monooxygenase reductase component